ncbi:GHKL domain-containing protein [Flavonifractor plautii]|nr:GHKL domain-containing protein [Flavonifractor plautii]
MVYCSGQPAGKRPGGLPAPEPGERRLSLTSRATEGTLFLLVENTYDGRFDRSEGHILSRKEGGVRCGIGLSSVQETVERHGGTMDLYPGEDVFQVGITLPIHNR